MSIKKTIFSSLLLSFLFIEAAAQSLAPPKIWDKRFGGLATDRSVVFCPLADGTFLVGGYSCSGVGGDKTEDSRGGCDYWVVKVDANGNIIWDKRYGGSSNDVLEGILELSNGKIILSGASNSDSSGDKTQNSFGGYDYWIVEIDQNGTKIWDKVFGGTLEDRAYQAIETPDHKIIIIGFSVSGINGNKTLLSYGGSDAWLIKIDTSGNPISQFAIGGMSNEWGYGIDMSDDGFIYTSIETLSGVSGNITSPSFGTYDYLVCKLDMQLNLIWQKRFGGSSDDRFPFIGCVENKIIVCGQSGSTTISGNKTVANHNSSLDYWSVILDSSGACLSQRAYGGLGIDDDVRQLFITNENNILVAGCSYSSMGGDKTQNNFGGNGIEQTWVILFDTLNNLIWDRTVLQNHHDEAALCCQLANGSFILGNYSEANIGGDKTQNAWNNGYDYFMICLAAPSVPTANFSSPQIACAGSCIDFSFTGLIYPVGTLQWSFPGGNPSTDTSYYPHVCYTNPGYYNVQLIATNSLGANTLLMINYVQIINTTTITTATICAGDTFTINGFTLTAPGTYSIDTLTNYLGCDSIINLQLAVNNTGSSSMSAAVCTGDTFNFYGNTLTQAGTFTHTLSTGLGCDSVITLQLSLLSTSSYSYLQKLCEGDSIFLQGAWQTTEGLYHDTLVNAQGCDSLLTTQVSIDAINDSVIVAGNTLTADATGLTYQWYNCDSSQNIAGATSQSYIATQSGNYAVWLSDQQGCYQLSDCVFVLVNSVGELQIQNLQFTISPNPASETINVYSHSANRDIATITITDISGRQLMTTQTNLKSQIINLKSFSPGIYLLHYTDGTNQQVKKFVVER